MTTIRYIEFPLTSDILTVYAGLDGLGCTIVGSNLRLYCPSPDDFKPIFDPPASVEIEDGLVTPTVLTKARRRIFELDVFESQDEVADILEILMDNAKAIPGQYAGVTVLDYIWVNRQDKPAGFTTRVGTLNVTRKGGTVTSNATGTTRLLNRGITIRFEELEKV